MGTTRIFPMNRVAGPRCAPLRESGAPLRGHPRAIVPRARGAPAEIPEIGEEPFRRAVVPD